MTLESRNPVPLANNGVKLLKIGDFAELAGTNLRTLRYYEELGLLAPASRSPGGFRLYRAEDVSRLHMVHTLQDLGLELGRIRELMDTRVPGLSHAELLARVRHALVEQTRLIEERMASLRGQREQLDAALAKLTDCGTCGQHPAAENNFCHPCQVDGKRLPDSLSALF